MATLAEALTALGLSAFALDALSDESDSELATMLADMGRDDTSVAELRGLTADAAAGASRSCYLSIRVHARPTLAPALVAPRLLGFLARSLTFVFVQVATQASP